MNDDQANYTKVRFKCKKASFIALLLIKMHITPNVLFGFQLCYVSRYLKYTSQQVLDTGNLMSDRH